MDKPKSGKKPFETPTLTEYGTLDELTQHHKPQHLHGYGYDGLARGHDKSDDCDPFLAFS